MDAFQNLANNVDVSALFIATFGALFSIASALYFTSRKISAEMKYRRLDLTSLYSGNILETRLLKYPGIWHHICAFDKILFRFPNDQGAAFTPTLGSLKIFNSQISRWDNENGLILSTSTAIVYERLRSAVRDVLVKRASESDDVVLAAEEISTLVSKMGRLELALRTDVGIYEVDRLEARFLHLSYDDVNFETLGRRYRVIRA